MKKISFKIYALLAVCILVSMIFSACNSTNDNGTHTHTYSSEWESDSTYHWHAATCEHTDEISDKGEHTRGEDNTCTACGYEMPAAIVDDGHSILSADGYDISGTVLTKKDRFSKDTEQYDLRGAFEISEGATWNVFTSADCKTESWLPNRTVALNTGDNSVYVLVEDSTGNKSTVYEVRLYRRSDVTVTVVYNETEQKAVDIEEDSPILSTLGDDLLADYVYDKYYLDSEFSSELSAELTATEDISLFVDAYYVGVTHSGGTVTGLNFDTRPTGSFKLRIDNALLGVTVTKIGEDAFRDMENMTECILPGTVTSIEKSAFRGCAALGSISLPNAITEIGTAAFYGCKNLSEITIPEKVSTIGNYAFFDCINLNKVYYNAINCADVSTKSYDDGVFVITNSFDDVIIEEFIIGKSVQYIPSNLFATDTKPESGSGDYEEPMYIKSLVFEDGSTCTAIGKYAFVYKACYQSGEVFYYGVVTADITLPSSVTEIGNSAFGDAPYAQNLYIDGDVERYLTLAAKSALAKNIYLGGKLMTSVSLPESLSAISLYWFRGVECVQHITLPETVTAIPDNAFRSCTGLVSIDIPNSVKSIGESAFNFCRSLKEIVIPDSVKVIPKNCFSSCYTLYRVTLPASLESFGDGAFSSCYNLVEVYNRSGISLLGYDFFDGLINIYKDNSGESKISTLPGGFVTINRGDTLLLVGYTGGERDVVIPSSIGEINAYLFAYADIDSVVISGGVKKIGQSAFIRSTVKSVVINGISDVTISRNAFSLCDKLETLTVGNNVRVIETSAFSGCKSLKTIYLGERITNIGGNAFFGCNAIEAINYTGTKVEWDKMQIGSGNDTLTNAERSYNCEI